MERLGLYSSQHIFGSVIGVPYSMSRLQELYDQHGTKVELPPYPPFRESPAVNLSSGDHTPIWTQDDTDSCLSDVPFDTYLGIKLYHTNPIDQINTACKSSGKRFVDYEFLVHGIAEVTVKGERLTPGIITQRNADDFQNSKERNCIAQIKNFGNKARRSEDGSSKWTWVRGSHMPGRRLFASDSASIVCQNVIQGEIGNSGFCSGFASLAAQFPDVLKKAFGTFDRTTGAFSVLLYPEGKARYLLLDDYVLCSDGTYASPALSSLKQYDLWIRFLEKTFVKLQSSYASLDGYYKYNSLYRHPARAIQLLTGSPIALELRLRVITKEDLFALHMVDEGIYKKDPRPVATDDIFATLVATEGKCCRIAHGRKAVDGLFHGLGYSLLWVGKIAGIQLACVRNPHGVRSYTGEFGRGRYSWTTEDAKTVRSIFTHEYDGKNPPLYLMNLLYRTPDNGVFLMRFSAFVECFPIVSIVGPISDKCNAKCVSPMKNCLHRLDNKDICRLPEILDAAEYEFTG